VNRDSRNQLAGDVLNLVAHRLHYKHNFLPSDSPTQLQIVKFQYLDTWKVFKECREGGVVGYSPGQCILHDSATVFKNAYLLHYSNCAGS